VSQVQNAWQPDPSLDESALDNPVWSSLTGPHARFAQRRGRAARYPPDVSPFVAIADEDDDEVWADLTALVGPGATVMLSGLLGPVPAGWGTQFRGQGLQLVATGLRAEPDPEAVALGESDVPEMLDLVARTQPGPFLPRTVELGGYLGIRRSGALVAMAGERLHPTGWSEISAVCTDPTVRGQGLATRLVRAVGYGIRQRGETPMLHVAATNTTAIRLYRSIGFGLRRVTDFAAVQVPTATPS
jgi:ribosomal protein S18 acetylase RimI-like enzyme